jgi:hypothetical protein
MNDTPKAGTWVGPDFMANRQQFPPDELAKYAGQYVAFNRDGTAVLASDPDEAELYRKVAAQGLDLGQLVIDFVDSGEHSQL